MEENNVQITEIQEQEKQQPKQETQKKLTHKDLYNTDGDYKKAFDFEVQQAAKKTTESLVAQKAAELEAEMTRAQELSKKSLEEQNKLLKEQLEQVKKQAAKEKEIESLKKQTEDLLTENNIPTEFMGIFDFANATADDIQTKIKILSNLEYYPKGELEKRISAALDEKLKQKTPETRTNNNGINPAFEDKILSALKINNKQ